MAFWSATLSLRFAQRSGRTVVAHRSHEGPLVIQKIFHPESDGGCHAYVVHPPGGVVPGDHLQLGVELDPGAQALLTTPAATKVYRSDGRPSRIEQRVRVSGGAEMEWLPQETIVFDGAQVVLRTRIDLDEAAAFTGWEIVCLGRPAADLPFDTGHLRQDFEIWRADRPAFIERTRWEGGSRALHEPWGLGGSTCYGTMVATGAGHLAARVREECTIEPQRGRLAVTALDDLLVARFAGPYAELARDALGRVWKVVRRDARQRATRPPRIWAT